MVRIFVDSSGKARNFTEREYWRLMGVDDKYFNRLRARTGKHLYGHLSYIQDGIEHYEEKLKELYGKYCPEKLLISDERPDLNGKFIRNGKFYICNGYLLVEKNTDFESLDEVKGIDEKTSIESLIANKAKVTASISDINEENISDEIKSRTTYKLKNEFYFNKFYVDTVLKILGEDICEVAIYTDNPKLQNWCLYIKSKIGRAVILGVRNSNREG